MYCGYWRVGHPIISNFITQIVPTVNGANVASSFHLMATLVRMRHISLIRGPVLYFLQQAITPGLYIRLYLNGVFVTKAIKHKN